MSVAELTEALTIDIINKRLDARLKCDGEAILEVCLNLLTVETQGDHSFFQFVHFSAREFLLAGMNLLDAS
jgi:hypothetical protein